MEQALINLDSLNLSEEELFSFVDNSAATTEKITAPRYSYWKSVGRVFFKRKINVILLALLLVVILFAFVIPLFSPFDMWENLTETGAKNLTPFQAISKWGFHIKWILGTGQQGESTFNAIWYGSRISLSLALICAAINLIIGIILGAIWGYSKHFDIIMTEVYNIVGNVPYILVISVLVVITGAGFWPFVFALTVTGWLGIAYFMYRKGKNAQISNLLSPLVGEKLTKGWFGKAIDIFSVVVSFAGVATSLGLGVSQICGGLNYLFHIPNNSNTWLIIIVVITCVFLASAIRSTPL